MVSHVNSVISVLHCICVCVCVCVCVGGGGGTFVSLLVVCNKFICVLWFNGKRKGEVG